MTLDIFVAAVTDADRTRASVCCIASAPGIPAAELDAIRLDCQRDNYDNGGGGLAQTMTASDWGWEDTVGKLAYLFTLHGRKFGRNMERDTGFSIDLVGMVGVTVRWTTLELIHYSARDW